MSYTLPIRESDHTLDKQEEDDNTKEGGGMKKEETQQEAHENENRK